MAATEKRDRGDLGRVPRLTLLAPDIVEAILDGRQPEGRDGDAGPDAATGQGAPLGTHRVSVPGRPDDLPAPVALLLRNAGLVCRPYLRGLAPVRRMAARFE